MFVAECRVCRIFGGRRSAPSQYGRRHFHSGDAWRCALAVPFLWSEGTRQVQLQRPDGIVFGEWAILLGVYIAVASLIFRSATGAVLVGRALPLIIIGMTALCAVLLPFFRRGEERRIVDRISAAGECVQGEYVAATPECKYPERWRMYDAQSAELEVLEFLKAIVVAEKPDLILETGTFIGHSAIKMAEGLQANGFGKIVTVEYDPVVYAKAKQNIDASGLSKWIECRNCSSLETDIDGEIDMLYSDSDINIREQEIRRFLPRLKTRGLVLVHDANSSVGVVRDAVLRLEQEGLLSVVLMSTPRGLVVAQKREGRK